MSTTAEATAHRSWPPQRSAGVLAHPTSLPGPSNLGDLGVGAHRFLDWLTDAGLKLWQLLPLNPIGPGASPYSSSSAFAGNTLLISLERLADEGLLSQEELSTCAAMGEGTVDFSAVIPAREALLQRAAERFIERGEHGGAPFRAFVARAREWLHDAALFSVIAAARGGDWSRWPSALRDREPKALAEAEVNALDGYLCYQVLQFFFERQWATLRDAAEERGITLVGDIPIYVSYESADVWANPSLFELDEDRRPEVIAGVPPDAFSETGQRWGNPLYRWDQLEKSGYRWWIARLRRAISLTPVVRVDHFRAFASYWAIPASAPDARQGSWRAGPKLSLFHALRAHFGELPLIAEDLGLIDDEVRWLRRESGLPGMKVVQFAFSGDPEHEYLPHRHEPLSIAYPGTHDNDTTLGWWRQLPEHERAHAAGYLQWDLAASDEGLPWRLLERIFEGESVWAIATLQDYLSLDSSARMNRPGVAEGNWSWRARQEQLNLQTSEDIASLLQRSRRGPR